MILLVDPLYNPQFKTTITSSTKLGPGITMAKFLGAPGTPTTLFNSDATDKQIARNLYIQAEAMRTIIEHEAFKDIRLVVTETNIATGFGTKVVYQVLGKDGKVDIPKSFDVAEFWKDFINYNSLELAYDRYNPDDSLSVSIVLEMPMMNTTYDVSFSNQISTSINADGAKADKNELIEYRRLSTDTSSTTEGLYNDYA